MSEKEVVKKSKCFVCGADVLFKRSKKNTVYYACNGEASAVSCGTRLFFGDRPSQALFNAQPPKPVEENHVRVQPGRTADHEKPAIESEPERTELAAAPAPVDQGQPNAGKPAADGKSGFDVSRFWEQR